MVNKDNILKEGFKSVGIILQNYNNLLGQRNKRINPVSQSNRLTNKGGKLSW